MEGKVACSDFGEDWLWKSTGFNEWGNQETIILTKCDGDNGNVAPLMFRFGFSLREREKSGVSIGISKTKAKQTKEERKLHRGAE